MKHASSRELYAYWNERRGNRIAPERGEIEPGEIRKVLGDSIILSVDRAADYPFRLAGTRVCALFCRELKGEPFAKLWDEPSRSLLRKLVAIVAHEAGGVVASVCGRTAHDPPVDLELLLLPLYHRGSTEARLLGVLAPIAIPYWLGINPIKTMALGSFRHLGSAVETIAAPRLLPGPRDNRIRRGLVVYEGGRGSSTEKPFHSRLQDN